MVKAEKVAVERKVREIVRATCRTYNAEEKIRIVLEGLRGEESIAEICRREGINANLYYKWSKEFLEAGKQRLNGDTKRQATSSEVDGVRRENEQLKQVVAELVLKNRVLKKSLLDNPACELEYSCATPPAINGKSFVWWRGQPYPCGERWRNWR